MPAEVQAFVEASIHARASGYLKNWFVDIGEQVTNGEVLAEIDTPELDQQLAQARAELAEDEAALDLAKITADRWTKCSRPPASANRKRRKKRRITLKAGERRSRARECGAVGRLESF